MSLINWLLKRKEKKYVKEISLENVLNYAVAQINIFKKRSGFLKLPLYKEEQVLYRTQLMKENGKDCYISGKCPCDCDSFEQTFGFKGCELGCYPNLLNEQDWNKFKKQNNVIFTNRI